MEGRKEGWLYKNVRMKEEVEKSGGTLVVGGEKDVYRDNGEAGKSCVARRKGRKEGRRRERRW